MNRASLVSELVSGRKIRWWIAGFTLFFAVGSAGHHIEAVRPFMLQLTPWFLLVFGAVSLVPIAFAGNSRFFVWGAGAFGVTFLVEAVGVETGAIFGSYTYGETLGLKVFEVPLVIGFNWLIVVSGLNGLIEERFKSRILKSVIAATGAMLFDVVLEPVAIRFDYWSWEAVRVPLQNYVAWWLTAFFVSLAFTVSGTRIGNRVTAVYVIIQAIFMVSLLPLAL